MEIEKNDAKKWLRQQAEADLSREEEPLPPDTRVQSQSSPESRLHRIGAGILALAAKLLLDD